MPLHSSHLRTAVLLVLGLVATSPLGAAPDKPVTITLPQDSVSFKGSQLKGYPVASAYCVLCHSVEYIQTQPTLSRATWTAEVTKMRKVFGAPLTDEQQQWVVDYLCQTYGAEKIAQDHPQKTVSG